MDPLVLRPRKAMEIVDAAIEVYRRNPTHFMLVTAAVQVPWLVLQLVLLGNAPPTDRLGTTLLLSLGTLISQLFTTAIVVQLASDIYLGRETDAFVSVQRIGRGILTALFASILQSCLIIFGLILFLLPAVYWSALYFAVLPAIGIEKHSLLGSFSRSAQLSRDLKLHILGALGVVVAIRFALALGVGVVAALVPNFMIQLVLTALTSILVNPLAGIVDALLYYDARIRHEGFDIEVMAGAMATTPAPAA